MEYRSSQSTELSEEEKINRKRTPDGATFAAAVAAPTAALVIINSDRCYTIYINW